MTAARPVEMCAGWTIRLMVFLLALGFASVALAGVPKVVIVEDFTATWCSRRLSGAWFGFAITVTLVCGFSGWRLAWRLWARCGGTYG